MVGRSAGGGFDQNPGRARVSIQRRAGAAHVANSPVPDFPLEWQMGMSAENLRYVFPVHIFQECLPFRLCHFGRNARPMKKPFTMLGLDISGRLRLDAVYRRVMHQVSVIPPQGVRKRGDPVQIRFRQMLFKPLYQGYHFLVPIFIILAQGIPLRCHQIGFGVALDAGNLHIICATPVPQKLDAPVRVHSIDNVAKHKYFSTFFTLNIVQYRLERRGISMNIGDKRNFR